MLCCWKNWHELIKFILLKLKSFTEFFADILPEILHLSKFENTFKLMEILFNPNKWSSLFDHTIFKKCHCMYNAQAHSVSNREVLVRKDFGLYICMASMIDLRGNINDTIWKLTNAECQWKIKNRIDSFMQKLIICRNCTLRFMKINEKSGFSPCEIIYFIFFYEYEMEMQGKKVMTFLKRFNWNGKHFFHSDW